MKGSSLEVSPLKMAVSSVDRALDKYSIVEGIILYGFLNRFLFLITISILEYDCLGKIVSIFILKLAKIFADQSVSRNGTPIYMSLLTLSYILNTYLFVTLQTSFVFLFEIYFTLTEKSVFVIFQTPTCRFKFYSFFLISRHLFTYLLSFNILQTLNSYLIRICLTSLYLDKM